MRKQIAAANWKMNLTLQEAETLMDELMAIPFELNDDQEAVFGIPFPVCGCNLFTHSNLDLKYFVNICQNLFLPV